MSAFPEKIAWAAIPMSPENPVLRGIARPEKAVRKPWGTSEEPVVRAELVEALLSNCSNFNADAEPFDGLRANGAGKSDLP